MIPHRELWKAPGARGIYGGTVIAQSLAAAFHTVPESSKNNKYAEYLPHSMHCYFILAGNPDVPILYYVERVREGRSFLTRTVQGRQNGKCIFTTTISFVAVGSGGNTSLRHGWDMPAGVREKLRRILDEEVKSGGASSEEDSANEHQANNWPFTARRLGIGNSEGFHIFDHQ